MKKTMRTNQSPLVLRREHIRLLTPTDLESVVGGEGKPTGSDGCTRQSVKLDGTCGQVTGTSDVKQP